MNDDQQMGVSPNDQLQPVGAQATKPVDIDIPIATEDVQRLKTQITSVPAEAKDVDIIEKEWVKYLEDIVMQTSHDPYTLQSEISKAKADYLKKRYNKDVKLSEG